jgi:hypothetical protein
MALPWGLAGASRCGSTTRSREPGGWCASFSIHLLSSPSVRYRTSAAAALLEGVAGEEPLPVLQNQGAPDPRTDRLPTCRAPVHERPHASWQGAAISFPAPVTPVLPAAPAVTGVTSRSQESRGRGRSLGAGRVPVLTSADGDMWRTGSRRGRDRVWACRTRSMGHGRD